MKTDPLKTLREVEAVECDAGRDPGAGNAAAVRKMSDREIGKLIHYARMYQPNRRYWHWTGGMVDVKPGDILACGVAFMSPLGGLCSMKPETVDCPECCKILEAPTNTLRLAEVGRRAVEWQNVADAYHSPERNRANDDALQRAWMKAEEALVDAVRAFRNEGKPR